MNKSPTLIVCCQISYVAQVLLTSLNKFETSREAENCFHLYQKADNEPRSNKNQSPKYGRPLPMYKIYSKTSVAHVAD